MSGLGATKARTAVLFVCTGNICRSPTAEAVFRALVERAGLSDAIAIDSAGTHDYQVGQPPDPRAIARAQRRGYMLGDRCARQIDFDDFDRFEWILAMDQDNLEKLEAMRPRRFRGHLSLFLDFAPESGSLEVPDPYSGDATDFDRVLDLAEQGAAALLDAIRKSLDRRPG